MRVWRVTHVDHVADAWNGEGARRHGGRWNTSGRPVVYASEHAALAVLELLAYIRPHDLDTFRLLTGTIPNAHAKTLAGTDVPEGWDAHPHTDAAKRIGDAWLISKASVALKVPSCLAPGYNILLNPAHPDFHRFAPEPGADRLPLAERAPR